MIYYVKTGDLDCTTDASSHRQAAIQTIRNSSEDLGMLVIVNENRIDERKEAGNVYFLTQSILDELDFGMKLVG